MRVFRFAVSKILKLVRILRLTNPPPDVQEAIKQKTQEFARRGFRTLGKLSRYYKTLIRWARLIPHSGVAYKEDGDEWKFLGLLPMYASTLSCRRIVAVH
jgi:H+-transporting ATPase